MGRYAQTMTQNHGANSIYDGARLLRETADRYRATCDCPPRAAKGCLVLDPFAGIGTTGQTARQLGARFVGIDLSSDYLNHAAERIFTSPRWARGTSP